MPPPLPRFPPPPNSKPIHPFVRSFALWLVRACFPQSSIPAKPSFSLPSAHSLPLSHAHSRLLLSLVRPLLPPPPLSLLSTFFRSSPPLPFPPSPSTSAAHPPFLLFFLSLSLSFRPSPRLPRSTPAFAFASLRHWPLRAQSNSRPLARLCPSARTVSHLPRDSGTKIAGYGTKRSRYPARGSGKAHLLVIPAILISVLYSSSILLLFRRAPATRRTPLLNFRPTIKNPTAILGQKPTSEKTKNINKKGRTNTRRNKEGFRINTWNDIVSTFFLSWTDKPSWCSRVLSCVYHPTCPLGA